MFEDAAAIVRRWSERSASFRVATSAELRWRMFSRMSVTVACIHLRSFRPDSVSSIDSRSPPAGAFVSSEDFRADRAAALATLSDAAAWPCFLKHSAAGSSVGVHRCATAEQLAVAADAVVELGGDLLVEAEVVGLETTVGVMGPGEDAATLPVAEVIPAPGAFFDHEQKYSDESGAEEYCPPRYLPEALERRLEQRARSAWGALGGEVYGRIDFIVPGTRGEDGGYRFDDGAEPVLLEANTLPGFTPRSLLPLAASVEGVGFRELCLELVARAL